MPEFPIDPDLAAVTAALRRLAPKSPAIDRDRLLYEAGRRSVRSRPWPIVAGLFVIVATALGVRLATIPPEVQIVYVSPNPGLNREPETSAPPALAESSPHNELPLMAGDDYLGLRDRVVRFGADSLPTAAAGPSAPPQPVEQLLGLPPGTLSKPQKTRWEHQLFRGDV